MKINKTAYKEIQEYVAEKNVQLVAVSKKKPAEDILELYNLGHRDFGENYVQELVEKAAKLPKNIHWHFIGHLQTNKVKFIIPFVQLIHGVDSLKLLKEINKQAAKAGRVVDCLLQIHIAREETKFGLNEDELHLLIKELNHSPMKNVRVCGLMGMASFSDDLSQVRMEFKELKKIFDQASILSHDKKSFSIISMGMSSDYKTAIEEGSNMVRIGSLLFGERH
jgi:PLP dependent protein